VAPWGPTLNLAGATRSGSIDVTVADMSALVTRFDSNTQRRYAQTTDFR
jgi:hypothetical protein